ncbi:MAG: hypothetical protein ACFFG0_54895 [Candidatus Thorarchaeota archaeon]
MLTLKNIILTYLLFVLLAELTQRLRNRIADWLPKEYRKEFVAIENNETSRLCNKLQDTDYPNTLLIITGMKSSNKFIRFIDTFAKTLTFRILRFDEILPVGAPVKLMVFFKNLSRKKIAEKPKHPFYINYPGTPESIILSEINGQKVFLRNRIHQRNWEIDIPELGPNEYCVRTSERFFIPEMPGTHELEIEGLEGYILAGPYGICDRKYKILPKGNPWRHSFHVSSGYAYRVFFVAFAALLASLLNVIAAVWRK